MDTANKEYPEFDYPASSLSAFTLCIDVFIISLKNGQVIRFKPDNIIRFTEWLNKNAVRDISINNGIETPQKVNKGFFNFKKKIRWIQDK